MCSVVKHGVGKTDEVLVHERRRPHVDVEHHEVGRVKIANANVTEQIDWEVVVVRVVLLHLVENDERGRVRRQSQSR